MSHRKCKEFPALSSIGGYTIVYLSLNDKGALDGDCWCAECAKEFHDNEETEFTSETFDEGDDLYCANCGVPIESSYKEVG